jgi:hypothetical protein
MCSSEHNGLGDEASTTESSTIYNDGSLMWELANFCWIAIYYLWCQNLW